MGTGVLLKFSDGSGRIEMLRRDKAHGGLCASDAQLHRVLLTGVSYPNSDFSRADLRGAFLSESCFSGGRFENAVLITAFLDSCDLSACCFVGASLRFADFSCSVLAGSDFSRADCFHANFTGADLRGANMKALNIETASFMECRYDESTLWPDGFLPSA